MLNPRVISFVCAALLAAAVARAQDGASLYKESCAQCHDAPPRYTKVVEWRRAKMSHLTVGLEPAKQSLGGGCPDCHSSQGFVRWQKGDGGKVNTFSIGFSDPRYNELAHARVVARHYRTDHHEWMVEPQALDIGDVRKGGGGDFPRGQEIQRVDGRPAGDGIR